MKKHYMLFTLLFTLLPFLNSYAEENKDHYSSALF